MAEEQKPTEKKDKPAFELGSVVTQTGIAIVNTKTGTAMSDQEALVLILNTLEQIKRHLG